MKIRIQLIVISLFAGILCSPAQAYDKSRFLNFVFFHLPPEYLANIPLEERGTLFEEFSSDPKSSKIFYEGSYLAFEKTPRSSKDSHRVWIKLLPRDMGHKVQNPYSPLVYIHTAHTSETDRTRHRTQILEWDFIRGENLWTDITDKRLPENLDRSLHLPPQRKHPLVEIRESGEIESTKRPEEILVWEDWKFHVRKAYPYYSSYSWDAPLAREQLTQLLAKHLQGRGEDRELAQAIVHAGLLRNEEFRFLLEMDPLRKVPLLSYALASYEYALDQNEECIDFMVAEVARTGNGDTNAKWMLHYFDEWDRTLEVYREYDGTDGAAAEASVGFAQDRRFFFPENFEKHWAGKMQEINNRK